MGWLRSSRPYNFFVRRVLPRVTGELVVTDAAGAPSRVAWQDEMFLHFYRPLRRQHALRQYATTGRDASELVAALERELGPCAEPPVLLEFACGYGRITRHLAPAYRGRHFACDIDAAALDFCARHFGVAICPSAREPQDWHTPRRFDRIFVASLFTHLPQRTWKAWLVRLADALERNGVLVFTTHGLDWIGGDPRTTPADARDAFVFTGANETHGRLASDEYGSTYVADAWVRATLAELGLVERLPQRPNALWGQDVWSVARG
jgi:SAM-dependent methyltransferase